MVLHTRERVKNVNMTEKSKCFVKNTGATAHKKHSNTRQTRIGKNLEGTTQILSPYRMKQSYTEVKRPN